MSIRSVTVSIVMVVMAAACTPAGEDRGDTQGQGARRGGTLRLGMEADVEAAFDPQKEYSAAPWGFFHCCLLRTLVTTPTVPSEEGGDELVPDLAAEMPTVSDDELTYSFRLREGIKFGPPLSREIVVEDVVTALERTGDPKVSAAYPSYFTVIEGFADFQEGKADSISGIEVTGEKTLEITLERPTADFLYRLSLPAAAPLPAEAIAGHEKDYGRFLVSSGPYMFEGSEDLDFDLPPGDQEEVAGYRPGRSVVLVRNPDWKRALDPVRPALVDRIEAECCLSASDQQQKIDAGELDISLDYQPPAEAVQRYATDPELQDRLRVNSVYGVNYLSLNIAEPPFDDIHVRKAANLVVDKASMIRVGGGVETFGSPFGHIIDDSLVGGLLEDYDPYATPDHAGDVEAAREEMRQSKYDTDKDGLCDAEVCQQVVAVNDEADPYPDIGRVVAQSFREIGVELDVQQFEFGTFISKCEVPSEHTPMCLALGWAADYADATTFGEALFGSASIAPKACCNTSLVGAPPELLARAGYEVRDIPNVDEKIAECDVLPLGAERYECWAELDRTLMEDVVPWIPYAEPNDAYLLGERITRYKYDQFSSVPALDQIALASSGA